jgi:hypothetical protein
MTDSPKARSGIVNIRKQFRKTKLCSYYLAGRCTFGTQCFYAHNPEDIQDAPDLKKTKLCIAWQDGTCANGSTCGFAHGAKELRSTEAVYKTVQCQWYSTGHCSLGSSCRYAHGDVEDRSKLTNADESSKKKKKKSKSKDKKPELPLSGESTSSSMPATVPAGAHYDPVAAAVQSEFLRSMESLKGNGDMLQQIVNLCSRLQLKPEDLPPPPPGLPSPFQAGADTRYSKVRDSPKPGAQGLSTPSTVASTAASPHFSPLDLGSSYAAVAASPMQHHNGVPLVNFAFPRLAENDYPQFQLPFFVMPHPAA